MPVGVIQAQQRPSGFDQNLDRIAKGLEIANTLFKIPISIMDRNRQIEKEDKQATQQKEMFDLQKQEYEGKLAEQERVAQGVLTVPQFAGMAKDFEDTAPGTKGAHHLRVQTGMDLNKKPIYEDKYVKLRPPDQSGLFFRMAEAKDKKERHDKELLDKQVERFGADIETLAPLAESITDIENTFLGGKDITEVDPSKVDLPGVTLPVLGRVTGVYGTAAADAASDLNTKLSRIFNAELRTRSGTAVTDNELERIRAEFAQGKYNTEKQMLTALRDYKVALTRALARHEARFPRDAVAEYKSRPGNFNSDVFGSKARSYDQKKREEAASMQKGGQQFVDNLANTSFLTPPMASAASAPPVGMKRKGFIFKGGDPKDKNNWEKE